MEGWAIREHHANFAFFIGLMFCLSCGNQAQHLAVKSNSSLVFPKEGQLDIQREDDIVELDAQEHARKNTELSLEQALHEEGLSIAIGVYALDKNSEGDTLGLTKIPLPGSASGSRRSFLPNYIYKFNRAKPPEYPGTLSAMRKPAMILTAINGLKFVPKIGLDQKGIAATFKFLNHNVPMKKRGVRWAAKLFERHPGMFKKLAHDANEQSTPFGAFVARLERQQYNKIKGNIEEIENRLGRSVFGHETWENFDSKQMASCACMGELVIESQNLYGLMSANVRHLGSTVVRLSKKTYFSGQEQLETFLKTWGFNMRQRSGGYPQDSSKPSFYTFLAYRVFKTADATP